VNKNILNSLRLDRQRIYQARLEQPLAAVYFGASPLNGLAHRLAMLHAEGEDG
jgi:hypothetical protein